MADPEREWLYIPPVVIEKKTTLLNVLPVAHLVEKGNGELVGHDARGGRCSSGFPGP
jgi:hypothetical protein